LLAVCCALAGALALGVLAESAPSPIELPTEWSLAPADGITVKTGTLPESATLTADAKHLVVLEGGQGGAALRILDPATLATQSVMKLKGAYGMPLPDASGSTFWASTADDSSLVHVDAASGTILATVALPKGFWAASIARSPDGATLAVSGDQAGAVVFVTIASGAVSAPISVGHHPAGVAYSKDGATLFVANWAQTTVDAIDVASGTVHSIEVGMHPEQLLPSRDGSKLYVSLPDDDTIAVLDVATRRVLVRDRLDLYGGKLSGLSPTALALSPDGTRLFATASAANAVVVLDATSDALQSIGAIPAGWYPTAVTPSSDGASLFIANGKGESGHANPEYNPFGPRATRNVGYIASNTFGSIRRMAMPDDRALASGVATVRALGGPALASALADPNVLANGPASDLPGRAIVRKGGPIAHVIYIVKENRTYDQVLGDEPAGDGDKALVLFDKSVTPNEHAISERFGLFDDTDADAQVSADGHNWSMAAFGNDYLEKMWPPNYGGRRKTYDFEDKAEGSVPHGGYLWNAAVKAGVTLRNYGEFTSDPNPDGTVTTSMPDLATRTDPKFRGFDTSYSDLDRLAEWQREFEEYVKNGDLPQLTILRYPNDHTAGTRPGALAPKALVAQNDLAVGKTVDVVSHSPYWKNTLIVSVEDDAQNGPDHVNAQRMTVYIASPYAKGGVQHAHYSTAGIVRTIELILGIPPMSAYDAAARPLYAAFTTKPDLRPYDALPESIDITEKNLASAYRAKDSARFDLSKEDAVDDATMNDVIWHAVRGADVPMPKAR
jgi:sugar lactone lactonase YvrE